MTQADENSFPSRPLEPAVLQTDHPEFHGKRRSLRWLWITFAVLGSLVCLALILTVTGKLNRFYYPPLDMQDYWVNIPAGEFEMAYAKPVFLDTFEIGRYEITNRQYAQCVWAGVCPTPENSRYASDKYALHPVIFVSWDEAQNFCGWLGGRLPTEAEWEKAARGGLEARFFPWGDEMPSCTLGAKNGANFAGNGCPNTTMPVGSFAPNGYGLYDMTGNALEWTANWYSETDAQTYPARNPTGPENGKLRVLRGGSWYDPEFNLYAVSFSNPPESKESNTGFRCVRSSVKITTDSLPVVSDSASITPEIIPAATVTRLPAATQPPATLTPTPRPSSTPDWPPPLAIPIEEVPDECLTQDAGLSALELAKTLTYWGYGDLSCRLFAYSADKQFLAYVQVVYVAERDTPESPYDGMLESVKVLRVSSGEIRSVYSLTKVKGVVLRQEWLENGLLNFKIGTNSSVAKNLTYDPQSDLVSQAQPTPTPAPASLVKTLEHVYLDQLAWSPDSQKLAASSCYVTCRLQLLKLSDLSPIWQTEVDAAMSGLYFSPGGESLAALTMQNILRSDSDGRPLEAEKTLIQWFNAQNGKFIAKTEVQGTVIQFEYSLNGQTIAALVRTPEFNHIWLLNAKTGALIRKWDVADSLAHTLHFSPWANQIVTAGFSLSMWDATTGAALWQRGLEEQEQVEIGQTAPVGLVSLKTSPKFGGGSCVDAFGKFVFSQEKPILIVSAIQTGQMRDACEKISVRNVETGEIESMVGLSTADYDVGIYPEDNLDLIYDVSMSFDEQTSTVTLMKMYGFVVWDIKSRETKIALHGLENYDMLISTHAVIHPQGGLIAVWTYHGGDGVDHSFDLYNTNTGKPADKKFGITGLFDEATFLSVAFTPDGHWLAAANKGGNLRLWNMDKYKR